MGGWQTKAATFKNFGRIFLAVSVMAICLLNYRIEVRAEYQKVPESALPLSTMKVYRDMDTSFLKTFSFGGTYEGSALVNLETAQQMLDAEDVRLKEGRIVRTEGFYEAGDGGGAVYRLSSTKNTGGILLSNGLYANILLDTRVIDGKKWGIISPKQLGAVGDGQQAEQAKINEAAYLAADFADNNEDIFRSIVYLPAGEYKCTGQIELNVSNVNFVGEGKKSVIFTDNDYRKGMGYYEFFFTIWGAKDLYMADFLVEAREVNGYNYMRQMVFVDCDNVYTYRVDLNIPQEAFTKDYFVDKQYSSLTYYSGNKNMTLDSCKLELMCSTYRGANLGILDFYCRGEENITVMNCELHSDARDEQVGIFTSHNDGSFIRNIYFVNNTMYSYQPLDKNASGGRRTMCFTVAYDSSHDIGDIYIKGNHFIADLDSKLMTFGGGIESCVVEENMMDIRCTENNGAYLFDSSASAAECVQILDNEIYLTYRDSKGTGKAAILGGKGTVKGNKIVSDTYLGILGYFGGVYEENTYINFGCLGTVAKNLTECRNNTVISYGKLDEVMAFSGGGEQAVEFTGNYVVDYRRAYEKNNMWSHVSKVEGEIKELTYTGNTYLAPNKHYWIWESVDNPRKPEFVKGLFFRGATIEKAVLQGNVFQGASPYASYGCTVTEVSGGQDGEEQKEENRTEGKDTETVEDAAEESLSGNAVDEAMSVSADTAEYISSEGDGETVQTENTVNLEMSDNEVKDFTLNLENAVCTSVQITKDGAAQTEIFTDQPYVRLGTVVKAGHLDEEGNCVDEAVAADKELVWYTSLEGIAKVNNGLVTRKNYGQVTVFALPLDGLSEEGRSDAVMGRCVVHFVKGFATGIELEKESISLQKTKKYKAVYEVQPALLASQKVAWTSSDTDVATVSSIGVIEAVGEGEADIICSTLDGTNISKKIHVKVEPLTVKKITLNQSAWYDYEYEKNYTADKAVGIGDTIELKVIAYVPDAASNKGIKKWLSTDEKVATVDQNGFVTAVGNGTCEIRAYSMDEKCYGACSVWVQPAKMETEKISYTKTNTSIKLEWEPVENVSGYIIYFDKGDGNGYQNMKTITGQDNCHFEHYLLEAGTTYQYKISTYLKRWDSNGYSHIYETPSDEIAITTYNNPVVTSFETYGVECVGVSVGATANIKVTCRSMPSSFKSGNEEIFTAKNKQPEGSNNYDLEIMGVKEGMANLIFKGEDELGYEKKIPVLVYNFQNVGSDIWAEPLIKSVEVKWKLENERNQDGFQINCKAGGQKKALIPMEQLTVTEEDGETYAGYVLGGLESDKDYAISVAPYKIVDDMEFAGPSSEQVTVHTPVYVNVDSIAAENLHLLKVGESRRITAKVETESASEPSLVWVPYHSSIIQVTESGRVDETTGYALVKGLKTGISKLSVVADDEENYQIDLKAAVVPKKAADFAGKADVHSAALSWSVSEGADGYAVYRYSNGVWANIAKVTETSYMDLGLAADTQYQYKIGAYVADKDGVYEGEQTDVVTLKTAKETGQYTNPKVEKPSKVKVKSVKAGKKKITLKWTKVTADGYEIQCCTSKKFRKNVKKVTVKKSKKSAAVKKLKSGKTYYVRIRAYSVVNGTKYYGLWSKVKKVKVK